MATIHPCLWFDGEAEEAARFYVSLLPKSRIDAVIPSPVDTPSGKAGDVMLVEFTLAGSTYAALNGGSQFRFSPATSLFVQCDDDEQLDRIWSALLEGGTTMACGWLTDRYGVTWQIVPGGITDLLRSGDSEGKQRMMREMMTMTKLDGPRMRAAYEGRI
jgi:predicted 3-demethylubiquinone-9 3-methyltransferase (glyoxalase superfamily)